MSKVLTTAVVILLLVILVFSVSQVVPSYRAYKQAQSELYEMNREYERKLNEYHTLIQEIHDLEHTPFAVEKVAREKFRMCREGEQIFIYTE